MSTLTRSLAFIGLQPLRRPSDDLLPALGVFGTGLAVGAGLGLLFAPRSGSELRHGLKVRTNHAASRATRTAGAAFSTARTAVGTAATKVGAAARKAGTSVRRGRGHVEAQRTGPEPQTTVTDEIDTDLHLEVQDIEMGKRPHQSPDQPFETVPE